jgi:hypothetical protein
MLPVQGAGDDFMQGEWKLSREMGTTDPQEPSERGGGLQEG